MDFSSFIDNCILVSWFNSWLRDLSQPPGMHTLLSFYTVYNAVCHCLLNEHDGDGGVDDDEWRRNKR